MKNPHYYRFALAAALALTLALSLRFVLVKSMALHMLVQIPLLMLAGIWLAAAFRTARPARAASPGGTRHGPDKGWNAHGIAGLLYATLAAMYWMIPKALDSVLLFPEMEVAKVLGLVLAGVLLYDSWQRAHIVIKVFFAGGFCWTSALVGMLYQESPQRLCNFYLLDDQLVAGIGLVVLAIALPAIWGLSLIPRQGQTTCRPPLLERG